MDKIRPDIISASRRTDIPADKLFGGNPEMRRDFGQRAKKGCKCTIAIDIGSYQDHPCYHNCLFCYANTGRDTWIRNKDFQ